MNDLKLVRVYLSSRQYKKAIDAHGQKLEVTVEGMARKSASQYTINSINSFTVIAQ